MSKLEPDYRLHVLDQMNFCEDKFETLQNPIDRIFGGMKIESKLCFNCNEIKEQPYYEPFFDLKLNLPPPNQTDDNMQLRISSLMSYNFKPIINEQLDDKCNKTAHCEYNAIL